MTPPGEPDPVPLDEIERTGATRFGKPVKRIMLRMTDGGWVEIKLAMKPHPVDDGMTPLQRRILHCIRDSEGPVTRKEVAMRIRAKTTTGDFARAFQVLLESDKIFVRNGEYADRESKFTEGT